MSFSESEYTIEEPLTFIPPAGGLLTAQVLTIRIVEEDDEVLECHLALQVAPDIYARIDQAALFNLQSEVRGPMGGEFDPLRPVELDVALDAEQLPTLNDGIAGADQAVSRLFELSQSGAKSPLLETQNWFALHVKQEVELPPDLKDAGTLKVGYSTLWANEGLSLEDEEDSEESDDPPFDLDALGVFAEFFRQSAWPFQRVTGQETLALRFKGDHGAWRCYAHVRQGGTQCAFYSICPEPTPLEKRAAVAEFITRANFGLIVGNFEMNWNAGEVRFKTSLDFEGERLSLPLVRQLVEANVSLMDMYLPSLQAVMAGELTPAEAVAQAEAI